MKVKDLDGKETPWSLTGRVVTTANDRSIRSDLHLTARKLLLETFPMLTILEEVPIPIHGKRVTAYLDFYLPLRKIAVEVQGQQHFKYTPHFHGSMQGFLKAKHMDNDKEEWCIINNITLIHFLFSESIIQWKNKLI
jgi:hypothetical protein